MNCDMTLALIGLAGTVIGIVVTYLATHQSTKKQLTAQKAQFESERRGKEQDAIVGSMADFLTEYTADEVKNDPKILRELDRQLERLVKSLHLKGHRGIADEMSQNGQDYLIAVSLYAREEMSREELGRRRISAREKITALVRGFSVKDI